MGLHKLFARLIIALLKRTPDTGKSMQLWLGSWVILCQTFTFGQTRLFQLIINSGISITFTFNAPLSRVFHKYVASRKFRFPRSISGLICFPRVNFINATLSKLLRVFTKFSMQRSDISKMLYIIILLSILIDPF